MPRSVNHVASRAKRKSILKLTRGYFGARKNVWTVAKNTWEKGPMLIAIVVTRSATSAHCGFSVLTLPLVSKVWAILSSWAHSQRLVSRLTVRCSPTSPSTTPRLSRLSLKRLSKQDFTKEMNGSSEMMAHSFLRKTDWRKKCCFYEILSLLRW